MPAAKNDITGDSIQTRISTKNYQDNFDTIFKRTPEVLVNRDGTKIEKCQNRCWLEVVDGSFICNKPTCEREI